MWSSFITSCFFLFCFFSPANVKVFDKHIKQLEEKKTEKILNLAICALWLPPGPQENVETNCNHQLSRGQKTWRRHWAMTSTKNQDLLKSPVSIWPIWVHQPTIISPPLRLWFRFNEGPQCYIGSMFYFCFCQIRMIWIKPFMWFEMYIAQFVHLHIFHVCVFGCRGNPPTNGANFQLRLHCHRIRPQPQCFFSKHLESYSTNQMYPSSRKPADKQTDIVLE